MQKLIVGNLKMNMESVSQRDSYCKDLMEEYANLKTKNTVVICPPIVYLEYFCRTFQKLSITLGTQDCFWELYGSYTGNTSPKTIQSLGAHYVIIGHSERRAYNHETNEDIVKKIKMALRVGLIPIVCVGFLSRQDEMESVEEQVNAVVKQCAWEDAQKIIFAYEPMWAIGSGKTPKSDEIHTMIMYIRSILTAKYGKDNAMNIPILYGGSVVAENVTDMCTKAYADGVLVGRASLSPQNFMRIVRMLN